MGFHVTSAFMVASRTACKHDSVARKVLTLDEVCLGVSDRTVISGICRDFLLEKFLEAIKAPCLSAPGVPVCFHTA